MSVLPRVNGVSGRNSIFACGVRLLSDADEFPNILVAFNFLAKARSLGSAICCNSNSPSVS